MEHLPTSSVRGNFADVLNLVVNERKQVVLQRYGKDVAAIVPLEDLEALRDLDLLSDETSSAAESTESDSGTASDRSADFWEQLESELI
ncbi:MAG: type II toxin-antitoxin system Phd/YefM family antitoxin [Candidatus Sumerlaeia bacterium]